METPIKITCNDCAPNEWDEFVRRQAGWTHFHLHGWRHVIESVFGHECVYLAAHQQGELAGVLPMVWVRSKIFGSYFVSMPFLNYGGPLGNSRAIRALVDAVVVKSAEHPNTMIELRSRQALEVSLAVSHRKIAVLLDLPLTDPQLLWKDLKAKVRSQVRRPRNEGVEVRFGPEQVGSFHGVYSRHMRDLGTPCQPRELFEQILTTFPEDVVIAVAYYRGTPVAGGFGLAWGGELEIVWASSLREYNRFAPNMLLYWSFLERAVSSGLRTFNFGRCTPGRGTHRFKRQWGGRDEDLWWYYHTSGTRTATPTPDDKAYALGPRVWRKLPLKLTDWLGPRLVRYIP
jgi:FemAB-related protein (PEP-CTERM system-associated)